MGGQTQDRYTLIGGNASPYSLKMRAHMHYRRLPYDWVLRSEENDHLLEGLRPVLVPVLKLPEDGSLHLDSTRLIYMLEDRHPDDRSVIPDSPAHAFLAHLVEDMADEWVTKMMFHYRWAYDADIHYAARWIADDRSPNASDEEREKFAEFFTERQIGRMPLVGCTPENTPIIEAGFHHILTLLHADVGQYKYLFGTRPSIADFGLYGQLRTLSIDPTPMSIMREEAQRAESWLRQLDDASGIEGDWYGVGDLPPMTKGMITYCAEIYLPFLAANATAIERGEETFTADLDGKSYSQGVFRYQVKCLGELKARYKALPEEARSVVDDLIGEAGINILS